MSVVAGWVGVMESYPSILDPADPDVRVDFGMAEAEFARQVINRASAAQLVAIHSVLHEARQFPEIFVGHRALVSSREDVEFAERAAIADLAMRLAVSENTIRIQEHQAATMIARTPIVWARFRDGEVSPANARVVAELAASLPDGSSALWAAFDAAVADDAVRLAPARFRVRARVIRARVHAEAADERHRARMEERRVLVEADIDGMSWLSALLPTEVAAKIITGIDAEARTLAENEHETRSLDQLRADILGDVLTGTGTAGAVGVRVGVMVPVLTLLGHSDQPGMLDGHGPIDPVTARRLAAEAPSFYRILTHPISGTVLDIDKVTLRVPADMRRWLQVRDQTCTAPGCGRRAVNCDLDHTIDRQFGGTTKVGNLAHLCRKHHRTKHHTLWQITHTRDGTIQWTSPTGHTQTADPPPF